MSEETIVENKAVHLVADVLVEDDTQLPEPADTVQEEAAAEAAARDPGPGPEECDQPEPAPGSEFNANDPRTQAFTNHLINAIGLLANKLQQGYGLTDAQMPFITVNVGDEREAATIREVIAKMANDNMLEDILDKAVEGGEISPEAAELARVVSGARLKQ